MKRLAGDDIMSDALAAVSVNAWEPGVPFPGYLLVQEKSECLVSYYKMAGRLVPRGGRRRAIGAAIRKMRKEKGMNVQGLADLLGLSQRAVENIEDGRYIMTWDDAARMYVTLGLDPAAFPEIEQAMKKKEQKPTQIVTSKTGERKYSNSEILGMLAATFERYLYEGESAPEFVNGFVESTCVAFVEAFNASNSLRNRDAEEDIGLVSDLFDGCCNFPPNIFLTERPDFWIGYHRVKRIYSKKTAREQAGEQIREAREKQGLTTLQLAEKCGLRENHVSRIEQGKYSLDIDTIAKVGNALGIRIII